MCVWMYSFIGVHLIVSLYSHPPQAGSSMADMLNTVSRFDDNKDGRLNQKEWSSFFERAGVIPGILEHMKALL